MWKHILTENLIYLKLDSIFIQSVVIVWLEWSYSSSYSSSFSYAFFKLMPVLHTIEGVLVNLPDLQTSGREFNSQYSRIAIGIPLSKKVGYHRRQGWSHVPVQMLWGLRGLTACTTGWVIMLSEQLCTSKCIYLTVRWLYGEVTYTNIHHCISYKYKTYLNKNKNLNIKSFMSYPI